MILSINVTLCAVPFVEFKKREKYPIGGVILIVKLQALAYNFTKSITPPLGYSLN